MAAIDISNLHLAFGDTEVLSGVNLRIEPGEFFSFLGPSGSGKSTLLRAIAGFGPRPDGHIHIDGQDVVALPPWKRNVGMVFQSYALWPHLSVEQNVGFGLVEQKVPRKEVRTRAEAALEMVGLAHLAKRMPNQLSGGQQQRIALARTIVVEPKVLLLDEPLSNLDASLRVEMRQEILALQRRLGLTTIFVTHDQEEANSTSDRMAVLDKGVIQQVGRPDELYDWPVNLFVANFLGTANTLKGRVQEQNGQLEFITETGERLHLNNGELGRGIVVLRPQNIQLAEQATTDTVPGRVKYREFLGSQLRYVVEAADTQMIVDHSHQAGAPWLNPDDQVHLRVNSQNAVVLREE